jgi:hypothetical protein
MGGNGKVKNDIERMQVFCAQMHVFLYVSARDQMSIRKKCSFFSSNSALVRTAHTYGYMYNTVYSSTNTGVPLLLQMNRKVELAEQAKP